MKRTTTPDKFTPHVKELLSDMRAKKISLHAFAVAIELIWNMRHASTPTR